MTVSPSPEQLSELVERLRDLASFNREHYPTTTEPEFYALGDEAADALESAQAEIARLNDRLVETQMLSFKWMEAHDKLKAGEPYSFPSPADLPKALAEIARLTTVSGLLEKQRLMILAAVYREAPKFVATICDENIDRSGALLGQVRELARAALKDVG